MLGAKAPAMRGIVKAYELRDHAVTSRGPGSMRKCPRSRHDGFVGFLDSRCWKALKTGS